MPRMACTPWYSWHKCESSISYVTHLIHSRKSVLNHMALCVTPPPLFAAWRRCLYDDRCNDELASAWWVWRLVYVPCCASHVCECVCATRDGRWGRGWRVGRERERCDSRGHTGVEGCLTGAWLMMYGSLFVRVKQHARWKQHRLQYKHTISSRSHVQST